MNSEYQTPPPPIQTLINGYGQFLKAEILFYEIRNALSEGVIEFILNFVFITLRLYSKFECKL